MTACQRALQRYVQAVLDNDIEEERARLEKRPAHPKLSNFERKRLLRKCFEECGQGAAVEVRIRLIL